MNPVEVAAIITFGGSAVTAITAIVLQAIKRHRRRQADNQAQLHGRHQTAKGRSVLMNNIFQSNSYPVVIGKVTAPPRTAARLVLDDVLFHNDGSALTMDMKMRNDGDKVALVTGVLVWVFYHYPMRNTYESHQDYVNFTQTYDAELDSSFDQVIPVSQRVNGNSVDRIQVKCVSLQAEPRMHTIMVIKVALRYNLEKQTNESPMHTVAVPVTDNDGVAASILTRREESTQSTLRQNFHGLLEAKKYNGIEEEQFARICDSYERMGFEFSVDGDAPDLDESEPGNGEGSKPASASHQAAGSPPRRLDDPLPELLAAINSNIYLTADEKRFIIDNFTRVFENNGKYMNERTLARLQNLAFEYCDRSAVSSIIDQDATDDDRRGDPIILIYGARNLQEALERTRQSGNPLVVYHEIFHVIGQLSVPITHGDKNSILEGMTETLTRAYFGDLDPYEFLAAD